MVTIGVLALQGDVAEHARALENSGARALLVRRVSELDQVDGLVIPGGESTTMSNLLLSFGLFDTLNDRIASGLPVYGTCAGMIMLASSILDGREDQRSFAALDMVVRRNAFGRQVDSYEEDLTAPTLGAGRDRPLRAVFIRAPWVEEVGTGVEILATTRAGRAAGVGGADGGRIVAVRQGSLLATSFHPEVGGDHRVHDVFVSMVTRRA